MARIDRRELILGAAAAAPVLAGVSPGRALTLPPPDAVLDSVIAGDWRTPEANARDVWRHPAASLVFWGLKPGDAVIDVSPGAGWWTDIIAPYLARTGGRYIGAVADLNDPKVGDGARRGRPTFEAKYENDPRLYGNVSVVGFGPASGPLAPPGTVDVVLVSREIHDWAQVAGLCRRRSATSAPPLSPVESSPLRITARPAGPTRRRATATSRRPL
jgi:predicted methyltransferase